MGLEPLMVKLLCLADLASAGHHQAPDQTERMKWETGVNKIVIECWIRSEHTKRKYRQQMK